MTGLLEPRMQIADLWIFRDATKQRQYVAIHLAPQPPFGCYSEREAQEYDSEAAATFGDLT